VIPPDEERVALMLDLIGAPFEVIATNIEAALTSGCFGRMDELEILEMLKEESDRRVADVKHFEL